MKILLYTPVFFPMIGGMETVSECMAELFTKAGHTCVVITPIKYHHDDRPYKVYRNPSLFTKIKLILWADIVYSNGATLALLPLVKLLRKPFVWKHAGYQASCIDGLGWVEGKKAPMTPWNSVKFHWKESGWYYTLIGGMKLFIRRVAAKYLVDMNVAITNWVAKRQPFKRQVQIYNPSPLYKFKSASEEISIDYDFVYMGRLVSEKGLGTLVEAFYLLINNHPHMNLKLLIIGDGNKREMIEAMVRNLGIQERVRFTGKLIGQELTDLIHSAKIAVVPSEWEEPMGIVAVELMAAERSIIVSEYGGLKECVGDAGLVFTNGNHIALAECMIKLLLDDELRKSKLEIAKVQVKKFYPELLIEQYINEFNKIINKN